MRIGNRQAEARAIELAEAYLRSTDTKGLDWKCVSAKPDLLAANNRDRKVYTKWTVLVEYSTKQGHAVDGPGVVKVDIAAGEVTSYFGGM